MNLDALKEFVTEFHVKKAIHVKRGFELDTPSLPMRVVQCTEELVELNAEVINDPVNMDAVKEEAADSILVFMHLLIDLERKHNLPLEQLVERAKEKMLKVFTFDPEKVTAVNAGFTRRSRA